MIINILSIPARAYRHAIAALLSLVAVAVLAQPGHGLEKRLAGVPVQEINIMGDKFLGQDCIDSALAYYTVTAGRYGEDMGKADKMLCVDALNNIGAIKFFLHHDYIQAFSYLTKGLKIAEETGYDISTISRATSNKYVQTPYGVYPLKYFFSESMQSESGEEFSSREIKKILQESIDNEDKRAPLTDDKLCELLKEKGYAIARRTVAKYREQLGVPVARLRKLI